MTNSPDLLGYRIRIEPIDHPHTGRVGTVIDQEPCGYCGQSELNEECGYDDLIVRLDDGTLTRIYEPEAAIV